MQDPNPVSLEPSPGSSASGWVYSLAQQTPQGLFTLGVLRVVPRSASVPQAELKSLLSALPLQLTIIQCRAIEELQHEARVAHLLGTVVSEVQHKTLNGEPAATTRIDQLKSFLLDGRLSAIIATPTLKLALTASHGSGKEFEIHVFCVTSQLQEPSPTSLVNSCSSTVTREQLRCVVCLENPYDTAFGCGHLCCCADCAACLQALNQRCPLCRKPIQQIVRIKEPDRMEKIK